MNGLVRYETTLVGEEIMIIKMLARVKPPVFINEKNLNWPKNIT